MGQATNDWQRRGDLWWLVNRFLAVRTTRLDNGNTPLRVRRVLALTYFDDEASWDTCVALTRDALRGTGWELDEDLNAALQIDYVREIEVEQTRGSFPCTGPLLERAHDGYNLGMLAPGEERELFRCRFLVRADDEVMGKQSLRLDVESPDGVNPILNGRTHAESERKIAELTALDDLLDDSPSGEGFYTALRRIFSRRSRRTD